MTEDKRFFYKLKKDNLSWFDIQKYDRTKSWEISDWTGHLMLRRMLKGVADRGDAITKPSDILTTILFNLLEHPVSEKRYVGGLLTNGKSRIWDRTVLDAFDGRTRLDSEYYQDVVKIAEEWYRQIDFDGKIPEIPVLLNRGFIDLTYERISASSITEEVIVDLNASDAQLMTDFKTWLAKKREVRKSGAPKKDASDADLQDWYRYRVLAFIDLDLFCHFTDSHISQATLGNALFPEDYDVDVSERIRKVVKPLAFRLMNNEFLSSLDEQAARAERKSG